MYVIERIAETNVIDCNSRQLRQCRHAVYPEFAEKAYPPAALFLKMLPIPAQASLPASRK